MNDSTSPTSPVWPTRWPCDSFKPLPTALLVIGVLLPFAAGLALALKQGSAAPAPTSVAPVLVDATIGLTFVVEALLAIAALVALPQLSGFALAQLGFRIPSLATLGVALLGGIVMAVVANGSASLVDAFAHAKHQQEIVAIFRNLHDGPTIVIFILFAVVFAPFAEETIFRVFFFNLGLRYGGFAAGAILSGALFGLAHGDVYAALPLALGGVILCAVYYRTRNAFASMISHAFFNALSIAALLIAPQLTR